MKYVIIGLGNFGAALSLQLMEAGHQVVGVDKDPIRVDMLKEQLAAAFCMDATDPLSLQALPFKTVDATMVCIGEDFGSSIKVTALLLSMDIPHVWARGNDKLHRSILEGMGVKHIFSPEGHAARMMSDEMEFGHEISSFRVSENDYVFKITLPKAAVGFKASQLALEQEFGLRLLSIARGKLTLNTIGVKVKKDELLTPDGEDTILEDGDRLVIFGTYKDFKRFMDAF